MALIRDLYAIEADIRGKGHATRLVAREERCAPILARLDDWQRHHRARASSRSPLGEALADIAKYRDGPGRFLTDGRVEIDNNTPSHRYLVSIAGERYERTIRPIALNQKNALFAGHDAGAEHRAVITSLIETCKMKAVAPHTGLAKTLAAIVNDHKQSQIDDLLPWNHAIKL